MTAPAAAPASAPIAPPPPRAPSQPPADADGFAAMLDSLPGGAAHAGTAVGQPRSSSEKRPDQPPGQKPGHPLLGDGLLLASLPFTVQAAATIGKGPRKADPAASLGPPETRGPEAAGHGASAPASAKAPAVGRLIGERAFHFGASASMSWPTGRTLAVDPPFGPDAAPAARASLAPAASVGGAPALAAGLAEAAPAASRATKAGASRAGSVRPANEAARSGPKPEPGRAPPAVRAPNPAKTSEPAESGSEGRLADERLSDPLASSAQPAAQAAPFGAALPAFGAAAPFVSDGSSAGVADIAPRAGAPGSGRTSMAPPVREIDVDLSPGGLEDVSMTMRLAGDRLSLIVRAASSHTLNSIEGARDAIADRLAAIGQPLDSLIIRQTGVKADGTTNGNQDGPAGNAWRPAQGAGGGSDDALSRRGAHRDRGR